MTDEEGLPIKLVARTGELDIVSLSSAVEDLINTVSPFEYRPKLEPLLAFPKEVLQILIERFPQENSPHQLENNLATMGWVGEIISTNTERTAQESLLLKKSTDLIIDSIKSSENLGVYMSACSTLFRFKHQDKNFLESLRALGDEVYAAIISEQDKSAIAAYTYNLKGYAHDNDLLEKILDRLHDSRATDDEMLKSLAGRSTEKEGYLRLRIIFSARRWLESKKI